MRLIPYILLAAQSPNANRGFPGDVRSSFDLDLNHDAITDLVLQNKVSYRCNTDSCSTSEILRVKLRRSNEVSYNALGAAALKRGVQIGPGGRFHGSIEVMAQAGDFNSTHPYGSWINVKNRYLGLKFKVKGEAHYGWARLSVRYEPPMSFTATLTGYAYETVPKKPIIAGDVGLVKAEADSGASVEPGSLGRFAAGAAGRRQGHKTTGR